MIEYNKLSFKQLKNLLNNHKNNKITLTAEEEKQIRICMRDKINNYLKNRNKIAEDLIDDINIGFDNDNSRFVDIDNSKYDNQIKKDELNINLLDRMNNNFHIITNRKPNNKIEIPFVEKRFKSKSESKSRTKK